MRGLRGDADISTAPDLDNANEGNDTRYFVEKRAFAVRFFFRAKGNYGSTAKKLVRCCLTERRISMQQNPMIYQLYAVTAPAADLAEQVKRAIAGGITMLQIREKNCTTKRRIELAYPILQLCRDAGIPCIIDDDAEAAKILGADGVHVGQRDMKIQQAREILGDQAIIGTSAHNVAEALQAERDGATYLGCGAVFSTRTKHDATFLPHDVLCDIRQAVSIPVVAIGGINAQNIPKLYDTGIDGVAVVSAVFGQPNVEAAAQAMRELTAPFQQKEQGR